MKLRDRIKNHNLTLTGVAQALGTTPAHALRLIEGRARITLEQGCRLAGLLGCHPQDILDSLRLEAKE